MSHTDSVHGSFAWQLFEWSGPSIICPCPVHMAALQADYLHPVWMSSVQEEKCSLNRRAGSGWMVAVHFRGQPGTLFAGLLLAWTENLALSQSVCMHPLNPVLRPFTWRLKGRKLAVGSGEKQEAKTQDHHIWTYRPSFFSDFQELGLESICSASPHLQALTAHPPKGEGSPNSAGVLWQMAKIGTPLDMSHRFVQLLSAASAYIRDVKKSEVSCKFSVPGPVLASGQGCRQGGKWERPLLCLSTRIRCYLPF